MPTQPQAIGDLLQRGIAAAKGGHPTQARALLTKVLQQDAHNLQAWLWLAGIVHDPVEQETCLKRVLDIDPYHATAQQGLAKVAPRVTQQLLRQGIEAARSGRLAEARDLLEQVVERDERQAAAWLWLSEVTESPEDQVNCLQNALALDPDNVEAQTRLMSLSSSLQEAPQSNDADMLEYFDNDVFGGDTRDDGALGGEVWDTEASDDEPYENPFATYEVIETAPPPELTPLTDDPSGRFGDDDDFDSALHGYEIIEEETSSAAAATMHAVWDTYLDEHACPYCATPAGSTQRRCQTCGHSLWTTERLRERRSWALWLVIVLQVLYSLGITFVTLALLFQDTSSWVNSLPAGSLTAPKIFQPTYWIPFIKPIFIAASLFSYALVYALYTRRAPAWYLYLFAQIVSLALMLLQIVRAFLMGGGILTFSFAAPVMIVISIMMIVFQALAFWVIFSMQPDFVAERVRVELLPDGGIAAGPEYLNRGLEYAHKGMWALAVVHFHQAANSMAGDPEPYRVLTIAGINLHDTALAQYGLENFQGYAPDHPQIPELSKRVAALT